MPYSFVFQAAIGLHCFRHVEKLPASWVLHKKYATTMLIRPPGIQSLMDIKWYIIRLPWGADINLIYEYQIRILCTQFKSTHILPNAAQCLVVRIHCMCSFMHLTVQEFQSVAGHLLWKGLIVFKMLVSLKIDAVQI